MVSRFVHYLEMNPFLQEPPFMLDLCCRMQEAQKRDSEAAELAAKMEKEKKEMQVSTIIFSETALI